MSDNLRILNNNIIFSMPIIDADEVAINNDVQNLYINVQRLNDGEWWDDGTWVAGSEPSSYIEAVEDGDTGVYQYILDDGYEKGNSFYRVHLFAEGIVNNDYSVEYNLVPKVDVFAIHENFDQAIKLKRGLKGTVYGKVIAGITPTNIQFRAQLFDVGSTTLVNVYKNRVITFIEDLNTAPANEAESVRIVSYSGATGIFTVSPMVTPPAIGDEFMVT